MTTKKVLQKQNAIAYNVPLRELLKKLHEMLGIEITDLANEALQHRIQFREDTTIVLKIMSRLASDLSILLIEAKQSKKILSKEEQYDFETVKSLTGTLGNLQFRLNNLIMMSTMSEVSNIQFSKASLEFAEEIMKAQQQFREVRANINSLGFLSHNPELARVFDGEHSTST